MNNYISKSTELNLFWLRIMKEHAIFIAMGLPCLKPELIQKANYFEMQYDALLKKWYQRRLLTEEEVRNLNNQAIYLNKNYINYKTEILQYNLTCQTPLQNLYALLIDHIRREAIHFTRELEKLQTGVVDIPGYKIMSEQAFWTRIMADHSKFIVHLLDPSERLFEKQSREFSDLFDDLRCQAVDLKGMIAPSYMVIPTIERFTGQVIDATQKLRDFKKAAKDLTSECKLLGEIPELLADHVLREAEQFLHELEEQQDLIKGISKKPNERK